MERLFLTLNIIMFLMVVGVWTGCTYLRDIKYILEKGNKNAKT